MLLWQSPAVTAAPTSKRRLAKLLGRTKRQAMRFPEHLTDDGLTVFDHVCRLGPEGIVSKRTDAPDRSGPSKTWLKSKNLESEAVRREREEEWHEDVRAFIVSQNIKRRHLNADQRVMAVAMIYPKGTPGKKSAASSAAKEVFGWEPFSSPHCPRRHSGNRRGSDVGSQVS